MKNGIQTEKSKNRSFIQINENWIWQRKEINNAIKGPNKQTASRPSYDRDKIVKLNTKMKLKNESNFTQWILWNVHRTYLNISTEKQPKINNSAK